MTLAFVIVVPVSLSACHQTGAVRHSIVVPKVTFFIFSIELRLLTSQAVGMGHYLRSLFNPLNVAGYLAWLAVAAGILYGSKNSSPVFAPELLMPMAIGLLLFFLICFLARQWSTQAKWLHPLLTLLQLVTGLLLTALFRYSAAPVLIVVAASQAVPLFRTSWLFFILAMANVGLYLIAAFVWQASNPFLFTLGYTSFQLFAVMTTWYAITAERVRDELIRVNADLLATRSLLTESTRDSERLRLSRELHDVAGHKLTALKLNLSVLSRDPRRQNEIAVGLCAQLADELLTDLRGVVQQMRLHDGMDVRLALTALASSFPRPRMHLQLDDNTRVTNMDQAEAILRTVQEAITNTARHSHADNIWLVLRHDEANYIVDIRDDGRGHGPLHQGNGLTGMRERLEAIGGQLQVNRQASGGVHVLATVPKSA